MIICRQSAKVIDSKIKYRSIDRYIELQIVRYIYNVGGKWIDRYRVVDSYILQVDRYLCRYKVDRQEQDAIILIDWGHTYSMIIDKDRQIDTLMAQYMTNDIHRSNGGGGTQSQIESRERESIK